MDEKNLTAETYGSTLGAAATGIFTDVDIEEARQRLRDVQIALLGLGYKIGDSDDPAAAVDGLWGPAMREAVATFQEDHDLDVTGQLDPETYEGILAADEEGLSIQGVVPPEDDVMPEHADHKLNASIIELLEPSLNHPLGDSVEDVLDADFGLDDTDLDVD